MFIAKVFIKLEIASLSSDLQGLSVQSDVFLVVTAKCSSVSNFVWVKCSLGTLCLSDWERIMSD